MPRPARRQGIEEELKQRIRDGAYPAAGRIPSRRALLAEFGVSPVTLQRALDHLAGQGFVVPRGSHGTFVAEHPPDRACHALVFGEEQGKGPWNRFWSTILREAHAWQDEAGRRFAPYFIAGADPLAEGHRRLCADLLDQRLAGVLFTSTPWYLAGSPVFSAPQPRVLIGVGPEVLTRYGASNLTLGEGVGPGDRLCRLFAADGRRRLAAILPRGHAGQWRGCLPALHRAGLETRPAWWLDMPTDPAGADCARAVTRLLFDRPAAERPDALFIGDDNLVPHATAGVLDAGLHLPHDLTVIAHANLPNPTQSMVPCRRFGTDIRLLLGTALAEIGRLSGGAAPRMVAVPQVIVDDEPPSQSDPR